MVGNGSGLEDRPLSIAQPFPPNPATLDDLLKVKGKAELINGRIVSFMPTGHEPNQVAGEIFISLKLHIRTTGRGIAYTDNMGFAVPRLRSGRQSFSPDASYYEGPPPANRMRFVEGAPRLAVEVRSEGDYTPAAELALAAKRADYFEAGTLVVWDVDPIARLIRSYKADAPAQAVIFASGAVADAEPAVPGWTLRVDDVFP
jgi:Uma2 family endonuclease